MATIKSFLLMNWEGWTKVESHIFTNFSVNDPLRTMLSEKHLPPAD